MSPAVFIILPTFTRLKYLPATVDSVFAQTFQDWQLIIADDGSDAQTASVCKPWPAGPAARAASTGLA